MTHGDVLACIARARHLGPSTAAEMADLIEIEVRGEQVKEDESRVGYMLGRIEDSKKVKEEIQRKWEGVQDERDRQRFGGEGSDESGF